jgi:hypothetical protein
MASWTPSVVSPAAGAERVALGHRLVDDYLEVVRARCRRNTLWGGVRLEGVLHCSSTIPNERAGICTSRQRARRG